MIISRKLLEIILPKFKNITDQQFQDAIKSTGNELPTKDIFIHPKLNNLVIGRLLSFEPMVGSDHLNLCKVMINKNKKINTIVCGAKNLIANKNVIIALEGAKLYDGRIIKYKELRGVISEGMICGYNELTPLNIEKQAKEDTVGVMLFDDGDVGDTNVAEFLGLDDTIYNIEVPYSNRHDIEGALAFCQDISAYFK
jgi:phenylalanyl-tRNA synthetase beta chain